MSLQALLIKQSSYHRTLQKDSEALLRYTTYNGMNGIDEIGGIPDVYAQRPLSVRRSCFGIQRVPDHRTTL